VCADNGLHSPIAEAMLNWLDSEHFEAISAGTICGKLPPLTVEVMKEIGIDLGQKTPKSVHQLLNEQFDYVITLGKGALSCDQKFPCAEVVHWKFDDPRGPMIQKVNCVNFERFAIRSFSACAYSFWFMFDPKFPRNQLLCP
jgi:protein-tyrosine-phosphatase